MNSSSINNQTAYHLHSEHSLLPIYHQNEYHLIKVKDIIRLEAAGGYTKVLLANRSFLTCSSISSFEARLSSFSFFRSHNSHLINLQKVISFRKRNPRHILMENQEIIPVSLSRGKELCALLGI